MAEDKKPEAEAAPGSEQAPEGGPDLSKKHPLENRWTLWFDNPAKNQKQSASTWGQSLRAVYTFDTVEDFWRLVAGSPLLHCPRPPFLADPSPNLAVFGLGDPAPPCPSQLLLSSTSGCPLPPIPFLCCTPPPPPPAPPSLRHVSFQLLPTHISVSLSASAALHIGCGNPG